MRCIKFALLFIGIDRECLQEILIHATNKILLLELILINLINLVNNGLQHICIDCSIGEYLLWKCILQCGDFIVKSADSVIESDSHQLRLNTNQVFPAALLLQVEYAVHTVRRTILNKNLGQCRLILILFNDSLLAFLKAVANELEEYKRKQ